MPPKTPLTEAEKEAAAKALAASSARKTRAEVNSNLIGIMMNVPLNALEVSPMFNKGGLRQCALSADSSSAMCIRSSGFDPAISSMCAIEVGYTVDEWKQVGVLIFELHQRVHMHNQTCTPT